MARNTLLSMFNKDKKSIKDKSLTALGNLIKLLPTGTVFLFQFLNPVFTNNGHCQNPIHKSLSAILIGLCGFSCCFSCFTDSYVDNEGKTHYGIVTNTGLWPSGDKSRDLSPYKRKLGDFVHAFFTSVIFAVLALLDTKTVRCFYPEFEAAGNTLLQVLPPFIGVISGIAFVMFPNKRHGIGYPSSEEEHK